MSSIQLSWNSKTKKLWLFLLAVSTLAGAVFLGGQASLTILVMLVAGLGILILLQKPVLSLFALIVAALLIPREFSTGTEVLINPATLLVPALVGIWVIYMVRKGELALMPSRTNRPLLLFLLAGIFSLGIGYVVWDPNVPRPGHFLLIQLAQFAIFAFSAAIFWLTGYLVRSEIWLQRVTFFFLLAGGVPALLIAWLGVGRVVNIYATAATFRAPFWILLIAFTGGQLLFNQKLGLSARLFFVAIIGAVFVYAFVLQDERVANWLGVAIVCLVLIWLRFPRRGTIIGLVLATLLLIGGLFPIIYEWGGGDDKWWRSGGSRIVLVERTLEVTTRRNPITGLGPAAYRQYAATEPLIYDHIVWYAPRVSSHNQYVDIFAHTGLLGLGLFLWFLFEVGWLGWRLRQRYSSGFKAAYVNGMLAALAALLAVMAINDWFLPFVYNVSFQGFQASILVWMFLGGLVSLEAMAARGEEA